MRNRMHSPTIKIFQLLAVTEIKQLVSLNRPCRPIGFSGVEDPTLSRQSAHRWRLGCQPFEPAALYFPEISSGTHFCQRLSKPQGHSAAVRITYIEAKQ
jgi:hypothetical protein